MNQRKIKKYLKKLEMPFEWYTLGVFTAQDVSDKYREHLSKGHGDHIKPQAYVSLCKVIESSTSEEFEFQVGLYSELAKKDKNKLMQSYGLCCLAELDLPNDSQRKLVLKVIESIGCKKAVALFRKNT